MEHFKRFLKIFGPLIGIILLYFVVRNAVFQFQGDAEHLSQVSPATMEEVRQDPSIFDELEEPMGEEAVEDEELAEVTAGEKEQAAEDEAAANVAVAEIETASEAANEELAEASVDVADAASAAGEGDVAEVEANMSAAEESVEDAKASADAASSAAEEATDSAAEAASEEAVVEEVTTDEEAVTDDEDVSTLLAVAGHHWLVQSINDSDGETVDLADGDEFTAMFADGRLSGATVCNNYAGKYQADDDQLAVAISATSPAADAPDACTDDDAADAEETFLAALQSAASFAVEGEQLEISNEDGNVVLAFESVADE